MIQTMKSAMNVVPYDRIIQMKDIDLYLRVIYYGVEWGIGMKTSCFDRSMQMQWSYNKQTKQSFYAVLFVVLCKVVLAITNVVLFFQFCKVVELEKTLN